MKQDCVSAFLISMMVFCFSFETTKGQAYMKRYKVQGKIINDRTNKGIKKIPVTIMPINKTFDAGREGDYLFQLPAGMYTLVFDYYPFDKKEVKFNLQSDTTIMIGLHSPFNSQYIQEVEVIASKQLSGLPTGLEQTDSHTLSVLPALVGERDVLKAFALTAGVTSSNEGAADLQVRGGLHGQNLYLLDGIPLYSTEHFFGMVSAYNPLIVKSANLYKSAFPTEYGGKISSVIDVFTKDADLHKFAGEAEISLLTTKLALNIPIVKDKLAISVAGRLSNYSLINLKSLFGDDNTSKIAFHFKDINANLYWKLSDRDKLKLTWFNNSDGMDVSTIQNDILNATWIDNRQMNVGLNWTHTVSENATNRLFVYADSYVFDFGLSYKGLKTTLNQINQMLTGVRSIGAEDTYRFKLSDKLTLISGGSIKSNGFSPIQINRTDSSSTSIQSSPLIRQLEGVLFGETTYKVTGNHLLTTGLRLSTIGNADNQFTNVEPRINYQGNLTKNLSISASVSRMTQPVHRIANPGLGFSFEVFMPSGKTLLPESSWNYSLGMAKDVKLNANNFSVKAEAWYRSLQNILEFRDGYDAMTFWRIGQVKTLKANEVVAQGNGKAYGVDISADYSMQNWSLSADYSLMKAENQFDDLNNGRPFDASTDIRHAMSLTLERKLSPTLIFSATWQYRTGRPITVPVAVFIYPVLNPETGKLDDPYLSYNIVEGERNNYRTRPFHKLDFSLTQRYKAFRRYDASFSVGVYNLYNRANPYMYYVKSNIQPDGSSKPVLMSVSIFTMMPSFNWSVKF